MSLLAAVCTDLAGQQEASPVLEGRVVKAGAPVDSATVVLHRVGIDTAGEIDSVRVDGGGAFRFDLPTVPDPGGRGEVYFASVRHLGILYFGTALHRAVQLDSLYTIEVHDTAAVGPEGADLGVEVRYMVAEPAGEAWQVTDLFQVVNDADRTLVPGVEGRTVWSHPLPRGARDVEVGGGDLPPDATVFADGLFQVRAPVPPGDRQFVLRYTLDELETRIPLPLPTAQMELLVREPAPALQVTGLTAAEPLEMDGGVTYRRYTATGLAAGSVVLEAATGSGPVPAPSIAVGLALLLAVAGLWLYMRSRTPRPAPASGAGPGGPGAPRGPDSRRGLLIQVARIDEALEAEDLDEGEAARLRGRRTSLVRRLQDMG
ncbi:MAG TPA: hypothetical protein VLL48_15150 [Longimicrobiales bacterium]|nr:hypothetical protein [Longimicrobiales bacterium]